jgi:hypothetical protein
VSHTRFVWGSPSLRPRFAETRIHRPRRPNSTTTAPRSRSPLYLSILACSSHHHFPRCAVSPLRQSVRRRFTSSPRSAFPVPVRSALTVSGLLSLRSPSRISRFSPRWRPFRGSLDFFGSPLVRFLRFVRPFSSFEQIASLNARLGSSIRGSSTPRLLGIDRFMSQLFSRG